MLRAQLYVRWLNAFRGHQYSIFESIAFEMQRCGDAACEPIWHGQNTTTIKTHVNGAYKDGYGVSSVTTCLLVKKQAIIKCFSFDCWSRYGDPAKGENPNKLYYGHRTVENKNDHAEAWYRTSPERSAILGIVVYNWSLQDKKTKAEIRAAARKFGLKIYNMNNDNYLQEVRNP